MPKGDGDNVLRVQVPARMEAELLDAVRAEARKNRRTLGQELSQMIEEALQARRRAEQSTGQQRKK
jgi:hypothetical protein